MVYISVKKIQQLRDGVLGKLKLLHESIKEIERKTAGRKISTDLKPYLGLFIAGIIIIALFAFLGRNGNSKIDIALEEAICKDCASQYQEGIYRIEKKSFLRVTRAQRVRTDGSREMITLQMPANEYFGLRQFKADAEFGAVALIDVALDPVDLNSVQTYAVPLSNLRKMKPQFVMPGEISVLQQILISNDEIEDEDQHLGRTKVAVRKFKLERITRCFANVKKFLLDRRVVDERLTGGSAWMAGRQLLQKGFEPIEGGPSAAVVNDICVYRGGWHKHGHVEVKVEKGWWYGYGVKAKPVVGRELIGCYRKPS